MKRFNKLICFILVFSISLSLLSFSAFAADFNGMVDSEVVGNWQYSEFVDGATAVWIAGSNSGLTLASIITDLDGNQYKGFYFANQLNNSVYLQKVSFEQLEALSFQLTQFGIDNSFTTRRLTDRATNKQNTYWCIRITQMLMSTHYNGNFNFLASPNFEMLVAEAATDNTTSTNTNYNYYTQEGNDSSTTNNEYNYTTGDTVNNPIFKYGDEITENNQVYDYSSDSYVEVGDISYDASTKQYTTNITIDNSVHVQYNIDHTSITYIGSSAEDKTYNLYYELPDGRNSSELTAEDLEQLVLNYNVINYGVSADDGRLRALYHFDGDLEDSSYWSKYSSWDWVSGASITYLESNAFGGALYLDEDDHGFNITLPNNLSASDFSVLFRYYHTATTSTTASTDFTLSSGSTTLFTGTNGTSTTANVPVGQWVEIGAIRDGSQLYTYINGIMVGNSSITATLANTLTFSFTSGAVTRQLDELRVYSFAAVQGGADYTPTAVPVDTNAVLILPDQAAPVPDGYWDFNTDGNLLTYQELNTGYLPLAVYRGAQMYPLLSSSYSGQPFTRYLQMSAGVYQPYKYDVTVGSDYLNVSQLLNPALDIQNWVQASSNGLYINNQQCTICILSASSSGVLSSNTVYGPSIVYGQPYTFTVMLSDGSLHSATFTLNNVSYSGLRELFSFSWGQIFIHQYESNSGSLLFASIIPSTNSSVDLIYQEFKAGSEPNTGHEYVTEIYSDIDLTMPTVAIRSQIPIREYRIGGVRPTVPYRGDVWLMVEDSYITSAQIYTGFAWQEVDLRIWTGQRWVSALYYNIMTQQDYTDILGTTDNEYIQSQEGFYSWLTKQFKELLSILNEISDQIEEIDSGSGASLDFTFEIDGSTTVEFTKLSDDARNGLLRVAVPLYDILFSEAGTIFEGVLGDFALLFDLDNSSVTVEDEETYSIWFIFNADQEVWNVRSIR